MAEKLKPINNCVLLKQVKQETVSVGGIIIADNGKGTDAWRAEVLAVGPGEPLKENGRMANGTWGYIRPIDCCKVGDHVYVPAYNGYKTLLGGTEYLLVKDTDILAVVAND